MIKAGLEARDSG